MPLKDMTALFNKLDLTDATIRMVEYDPAIFQPKQWSTFIAGVREWCEKGATLRYYLINPEPQSRGRVDELRSAGVGRVEILERVEVDVNESQAKNLYTLRVTHPTLIELQEGKAMWIEWYHPTDNFTGYSIVFIGPQAMHQKEEAEFAGWSEMLSELEFAFRVAPAPVGA